MEFILKTNPQQQLSAIWLEKKSKQNIFNELRPVVKQQITKATTDKAETVTSN
jgi:hypothetical protein